MYMYVCIYIYIYIKTGCDSLGGCLDVPVPERV